MKGLLFRIVCLVFVFSLGSQSDAFAKRKIIKPKECRTSNYTCVLKKVGGVPFFCVRTAKQRQQNARKKMRIVSSRNCIRRYPVQYEDEVSENPRKDD